MFSIRESTLYKDCNFIQFNHSGLLLRINGENLLNQFSYLIQSSKGQPCKLLSPLQQKDKEKTQLLPVKSAISAAGIKLEMLGFPSGMFSMRNKMLFGILRAVQLTFCISIDFYKQTQQSVYIKIQQLIVIVSCPPFAIRLQATCQKPISKQQAGRITHATDSFCDGSQTVTLQDVKREILFSCWAAPNFRGHQEKLNVKYQERLWWARSRNFLRRASLAMRWVFLLASLMRVEVSEMMIASFLRKVTMAMRQSFMQNCCSSSSQISHFGSCTWKKYWMTDSFTQWLIESLIFFMQRQNLFAVQEPECGQNSNSLPISFWDLFFFSRNDIIWLTRFGTMFLFQFFHSILKSNLISYIPNFQHFRQVGLGASVGTFSIVRDSDDPSMVSDISVLSEMREGLASAAWRAQTDSAKQGLQL